MDYKTKQEYLKSEGCVWMASSFAPIAIGGEEAETRSFKQRAIKVVQ